MGELHDLNWKVAMQQELLEEMLLQAGSSHPSSPAREVSSLTPEGPVLPQDCKHGESTVPLACLANHGPNTMASPSRSPAKSPAPDAVGSYSSQRHRAAVNALQRFRLRATGDK